MNNIDKKLDEILGLIYTCSSQNESLLNHDARTSEEWFAHKEAELLHGRAALKALMTEFKDAVIGKDVPIFVDGQEVKKGDAMVIELTGGVDSPRFRESCKNIQENGRNLEKADARQRANDLLNRSSK